ncbi:MAG TPA: RpiB/LacA/LacB family sugar-phosphate isomerase, partial [Candidatus Baltobacteraceae bacterium]|nr:RpiB/LacA/LacB family sugar-phosphate isomerase [Candidatus Baltobacteraceae bacterium]
MIYLGSDHAGYELKQEVARLLRAAGQDVTDLGALDLDPDDDYPDYAFAVGQAVADNPDAMGILACGSAQG